MAEVPRWCSALHSSHRHRWLSTGYLGQPLWNTFDQCAGLLAAVASCSVNPAAGRQPLASALKTPADTAPHSPIPLLLPPPRANKTRPSTQACYQIRRLRTESQLLKKMSVFFYFFTLSPYGFYQWHSAQREPSRGVLCVWCPWVLPGPCARGMGFYQDSSLTEFARPGWLQTLIIRELVCFQSVCVFRSNSSSEILLGMNSLEFLTQVLGLSCVTFS